MTAPFDTPSLTLERLKELLHYNADTGAFTRIKIGTPGNQRFVNQIAGSREVKGYQQIKVDGKKTYKAHRLAWFYMTGKWPDGQIDHINGDKSDNRFSNLRQATPGQNQQNRLSPRTNTSGYKGIYKLPRKRPWRAFIHHNGKQIYLGCFYTREEAAHAYVNAAKTYHREFARVYDL
jgi:AP2 domain.